MLSIIIPTYNEQEYLPLLLRSIVAQSYKEYEIIVADAASKDRTREIAAEYGARVVEGGLPSAGRNHGAAVAKGDIILFLDSDVILPDPWFLQMTIGEFEKRQLDAATCAIDPMSKKAIDKVFHSAFNYFMWVTAATAPHAPGFCIFVRKAMHDKVGGFDEEIKLAEDHDYVYRIGKIGKFGLLKTYKIPVSVRRFERDGRANIALKYLLSELHMRAKGPIKSDIFKYTFGYDQETKKAQKQKRKDEKRKKKEASKNI